MGKGKRSVCGKVGEKAHGSNCPCGSPLTECESEEELLPRRRKQQTRGHCTNMSQQHKPQADSTALVNVLSILIHEHARLNFCPLHLVLGGSHRVKYSRQNSSHRCGGLT